MKCAALGVVTIANCDILKIVNGASNGKLVIW